jgi:hypothetical protein
LKASFGRGIIRGVVVEVPSFQQALLVQSTGVDNSESPAVRERAILLGCPSDLVIRKRQV